MKEILLALTLSLFMAVLVYAQNPMMRPYPRDLNSTNSTITGDLVVGNDCTSITVNGEDLCVDGDLGVDGDIYLDGSIITDAVNNPYILLDDNDATDIYIQVDDTGNSLEISTDSTIGQNVLIEIFEAGGTISAGSLTPVTDSTADFAANFTGRNLYGGTFIANADDGDLVLPVMLVGMNFTVITLGAIEVVIDTNVADGYLMDGTTGTEGKNLTNLSVAGDIAVIQYYTADDWLITTNGWTPE